MIRISVLFFFLMSISVTNHVNENGHSGLKNCVLPKTFLWGIIPLLVVEEALMISELSWVYRRTWCGLKQMGVKKEVDRDAKERLLGDETPEFEPVDR